MSKNGKFNKLWWFSRVSDYSFLCVEVIRWFRYIIEWNLLRKHNYSSLKLILIGNFISNNFQIIFWNIFFVIELKKQIFPQSFQQPNQNVKTKVTHWTTKIIFAYVTKKTSKFEFLAFNLLFLHFLDKIKIN